MQVVVTKEKKPIIETSSNRKEGTTARHSSPHLLHNHVFQYFHFLPIISSQRYRFSKAIKKSEKKAHMQHEDVGHGIGSTECHTLFMGEMMLERGTKKSRKQHITPRTSQLIERLKADFPVILSVFFLYRSSMF